MFTLLLFLANIKKTVNLSFKHLMTYHLQNAKCFDKLRLTASQKECVINSSTHNEKKQESTETKQILLCI